MNAPDQYVVLKPSNWIQCRVNRSVKDDSSMIISYNTYIDGMNSLQLSPCINTVASEAVWNNWELVTSMTYRGSLCVHMGASQGSSSWSIDYSPEQMLAALDRRAKRIKHYEQHFWSPGLTNFGGSRICEWNAICWVPTVYRVFSILYRRTGSPCVSTHLGLLGVTYVIFAKAIIEQAQGNSSAWIPSYLVRVIAHCTYLEGH